MEDGNTSQLFVLGQIRDNMAQQTQISEQVVDELKQLGKKVDSLKNELNSLSDITGEMNAKMETLKGQGGVRNQMLESLSGNQLENFFQLFTKLGDSMSIVKSNSQTSTAWLEQVAGAFLENTKTEAKKGERLAEARNQLLGQLVEESHISNSRLSQDILKKLDAIATIGTDANGLSQKEGEALEKFSQNSTNHFDDLKTALNLMAAEQKATAKWLKGTVEPSVSELFELELMGKKEQQVPFLSYQYLWNYSQFFVGTNAHKVEEHRQNWVCIVSTGKDLDGNDFTRKGWLNVTAPEWIWVVNDYEKMEEEREKVSEQVLVQDE